MCEITQGINGTPQIKHSNHKDRCELCKGKFYAFLIALVCYFISVALELAGWLVISRIFFIAYILGLVVVAFIHAREQRKKREYSGE